jgi:tetratricopeptide (TPR) repeat protein
VLHFTLLGPFSQLVSDVVLGRPATRTGDVEPALGDQRAALITNNSEIALDPDCVQTDLNQTEGQSHQFLEGFDVSNAEEFESWLREARARFENKSASNVAVRPVAPEASGDMRLYLSTASEGRLSATQLKGDILVDGLAKSFEEFGLGQVIDGRFYSGTPEEHIARARSAGCTLLLFGETAEGPGGSVIRLKVIEAETASMVWSRSLVGQDSLDVEDPRTIALVAEFIDVLAHQMSRDVSWTNENLMPAQMAIVGVYHAFKLGSQNFEVSDRLLKRAYEERPKAVHLAWRGFLRTFMMCETGFASPEAIIEEGVSFARRALEIDPHNSMVLALSAQIENVMNLSFQRGLELSTRALEINRCNPMAWASLGLSSAYLGRATDGSKMSETALHMAAGSWYSAQADCWASAANAMAGDVKAARAHAERSHGKSRTYTPPMRYLSALYCVDGQYDQALAMAEKLKRQEPGFTLDSLRQVGYPVQSLRQAQLLNALPRREI